jgi:ADP-heptose:LPS heptosyltransferase
MGKVMVIQLARLGDLIQTIPLLSALKNCLNFEVTLVIDERLNVGLEGQLPVDYVLPLNLKAMAGLIQKAGILTRYREFCHLLQPLRETHYQCAFNLNLSPLNSAILTQVKADSVKGFIPAQDRDGFHCSPPLRVLFNQGQHRRFARIHIADLFRLLSGLSEVFPPPFWKLSPSGLKFANRIIEDLQNKGHKKFCALHLSAGAPSRKWGVEKFARLTDILGSSTDLAFLLIGTEIEERRLFFQNLNNHSAVCDLINKTDLQNLSALLSQVDLTIGVDSGPLHLASAVGGKTLSLYFGSAQCYETGPLGEGHIVLQTALDCSPCKEDKPACDKFDCRELISPETVAEVAKNMLSNDQNALSQIRLPDNISLLSAKTDHFGQYYQSVINGHLNRVETPLHRNLWFNLLKGNGGDGFNSILTPPEIAEIEREVIKLAEIPRMRPLTDYYFLTRADEGQISAASEFLRAKEFGAQF